MYKALITLLIVLSPFFTQAQQWINCTSGSHVNDIVEDDDVLWIATDGGLVKYNQISGEKEFFNRSNANIPTDNITSLVLDNENRIWVGSGEFYGCNEGVAYYDGDEWTRIDSICGVLAQADNGDVLIVSSQRLYRFDGTNFSFVDFTGNICAIPKGIAASPVNGDIWMSFYDYGCYSVMKYDGESFEVFNDQNSPISFAPTSNNSIYIDETGKVWLGTSNGVFVYDGNDWTSYTASNSNLSEGVVSSIKEDAEGLIWVGLDYYYSPDVTLIGLASFDGENWESYELPNEYKFANIVNVVLPVGDEIFVGTEDGLFSYDLSVFERILTSNTELVANTVPSILHHEGDTWINVGTSSPYDHRNIVKINGDDWMAFDATNSPFFEDKGLNIMDIDESGHVYARTGNRIYFYNGVDWNLFEIPDLVDNVVESWSELRFDRNNQPWLFNHSGYIFRYTGTEWVVITAEEHGNISGIYSGIYFDENTNDLWMGAYAGLFHFDGTTWTQYTDFGLGNNTYVHDVKVDTEGNVWIAANNGIAKFDGNTFTPYSTQDMGITSIYYFWAIEIDEAGHIWAGTFNTLVDFDGENWEVYTTQNSGLPNGEIYALAEDEYQNMWIGTRNSGFAIFNKNGIEGQGEHTAVDEIEDTFPLAVYPTITNTEATIYIDLPSDNTTRFGQLIITDASGRQLYQSQVSLQQGKHAVDLTGVPLSSGTYFISVIINKKKYVGKIVIL